MMLRVYQFLAFDLIRFDLDTPSAGHP